MKLVIIRHPETNKLAGLSGDPEAPSPQGLRQLSSIVDRCRAESVQAVFHSTLRRTTIIAASIAEDLQVPNIAEEGLQERDLGDWNTWEWSQIVVELDKLGIDERYEFIPPNGESWRHMEMRLQQSISRFVTLGYDSVAIVTHMGPIRALLPMLKREPRESTLQLLPEPGEVFVEEYETTGP